MEGTWINKITRSFRTSLNKCRMDKLTKGEKYIVCIFINCLSCNDEEKLKKVYLLMRGVLGTMDRGL